MYRIIRMYFNEHQSRVIKKDLTLEEAQEHCRDPETSSRTCSSHEEENRLGPWFDGYEEQ